MILPIEQLEAFDERVRELWRRLTFKEQIISRLLERYRKGAR